MGDRAVDKIGTYTLFLALRDTYEFAFQDSSPVMCGLWTGASVPITAGRC